MAAQLVRLLPEFRLPVLAVARMLKRKILARKFQEFIFDSKPVFGVSYRAGFLELNAF
ncbi:hypothetical protein [Nisaea sp.]|uniref:hypothetical protein n=1 Tax=Nisaea sp. TaxID=2024842 RepID=UPI002B276452|nr:hypothetical protein [Nisaea sp.]